MFADAVQLLAVALVAGWLGLLVLVARGRAGGRRGGPALVLATGAAVVAFGLQAALADGVDDAGGGATRLDAAAAAVAVAHRTPALTALATTLDVAAGLVGLAVLAAGVAAVLIRHGRRVEAALVAGAPAVAGLLGQAAKLGYGRDRPPVSGHLVAVGGSSLPSGHTLDATIVLGVLAVVAVSLVRGRLARVAILAIAGAGIAVAGAARVYLGVHWATDVLAGWLLGAAWVALAAALLLPPRGERSGPRSPGAAPTPAERARPLPADHRRLGRAPLPRPPADAATGGAPGRRLAGRPGGRPGAAARTRVPAAGTVRGTGRAVSTAAGGRRPR